MHATSRAAAPPAATPLPRHPSRLARVVAAVFGRVLHLPAGTPIYSAKRYHYRWSETYAPMRVRVGWWNRRAFPYGSDGTQYYFFQHRSTCYALPAEP